MKQTVGKNQKKISRVSLREGEMGNSPAYDSPISKLTSGMAEPSTANPSKVQMSTKTGQSASPGWLTRGIGIQK